VLFNRTGRPDPGKLRQVASQGQSVGLQSAKLRKAMTGNRWWQAGRVVAFGGLMAFSQGLGDRRMTASDASRPFPRVLVNVSARKRGRSASELGLFLMPLSGVDPANCSL